ncbi:hypothetical protein [Pedobacter nototheniae]|uniref:hypothetical protein n=1 Tax=Pedobacter nototheniae TaxID=2488994 RepID=UPI0029313507|nr:hypothetical protein [Pedobacter nototheniae]
MKKNIFIICFLFLCHSSFAQVFLRSKPQNVKADVAFSEPTSSIIFFGTDDGSAAFQKHKKNISIINNYFGPVYAVFPIFNIGDGKLVEYQNKTSKYYFFKPTSKKTFGMVISNGNTQPVIVNSPDNYLKTIKVYLNISSADDLIPKTLAKRDEKAAQREMEQILKLKFEPGKDYADKLIKNSNTVHYSKPYDDGGYKMNCNDRIFEVFADSLLTQKSNYGAKYQYNKNNEMIGLINTIDGKDASFSKYVRNKNGLIEMIIGGDLKSADTTFFIYEKDKYHTISKSKGALYGLETFFLNDQMQCVRRLSKNNDQSVVWDITYIYDKFGRLVREGKVDSEMIYEYKSDQDMFFSGFRSYDLNPKKMILNNQIFREKNKQTFIGRDGMENQNFRSVTYTSKDGSSKTYSYDKDNKLTSVAVVRCE